MAPTRPHTASRETPERRAAGSRRPARILLVEDDDDLRLLLALVLKRAGYEVSAAANADEALQTLHRGRHDLILTDYWLPGKDGLEFLAEARTEGTLAGAPAILCTAFPPNRPSGVVTVLEKPIDLDALLRQIRAVLKR